MRLFQAGKLMEDVDGRTICQRLWSIGIMSARNDSNPDALYQITSSLGGSSSITRHKMKRKRSHTLNEAHLDLRQVTQCVYEPGRRLRNHS